MSTPQYVFGVGQLFFTPKGGAPVQVGALNGVSLGFEFQVKELYGLGQIALTAGRYGGKITGKVDFGQISSGLLGSLMFGSSSSGSTRIAQDETYHVTGSNPVTVASAATYIMNQGVARLDTQQSLTRVAAAPVGLQYTVDETAGVYAFDPALPPWDALISYSYYSAGGATVPLLNRILGDSPMFQLTLRETFGGQDLAINLYACKFGKISIPTKQTDFVIQSTEFSVASNDAGVLGDISFAESQGSYWTASTVYGLAYVEQFNATATFFKGYETVPPMDQFTASAALTSGTVGTILRSYTNGVAEQFTTSAAFLSGNVTTILRTYGNGVPEQFTAAAAWASGTVDPGLFSYTQGIPEQFTASATFAGGTIT